MGGARLAFIDWMKCIGITLIVYGHVSPIGSRLIPPIYPKQLGVAFFVFVTGYSLARETRSSLEIAFKRLFEIYLFGIAAAVIVSAFNWLWIGDINESNYLPFFFGVNVILDYFPANPTTWFIGTYIHIIFIFAFMLKSLRVQPWMLVVVMVGEIVIRSILLSTAGRFVAYMAFTNWMTVFLMGLYCGQRHQTDAVIRPTRYLLMIAALLAVWSAMGLHVAAYTFPFMTLAYGDHLGSVASLSIVVTFIYAAFTWLTYQATRLAPSAGILRFLARNTLLVFIVHMPIYYTMRGPLERWTHVFGVRVAVLMVACLIVPAIASELIIRAIRPRALRDRLWLGMLTYWHTLSSRGELKITP